MLVQALKRSKIELKRLRPAFSSSPAAKKHEAVVVTQSDAASTGRQRNIPKDGLLLHDFVAAGHVKQSRDFAKLDENASTAVYAKDSLLTFHIKTYGCQMNVNDSDIVRRLLLDAGYTETLSESDANVLLTNTCAIREGAETKVWQRLRDIKGRLKRGRQHKIVGVLGCMAERLQEELFRDDLAHLVVGPDAYRDLPRLVQSLSPTTSGSGLDIEDDDDYVNRAVNVQLSLDETYADITPVRPHHNNVSAFVSIQRGCANRCSFCIVPFTRGQERSRPLESIVDEIKTLYNENGVKEVTLLGQNVNSYHDTSQSALMARPDNDSYTMSNDGFRSRIRRSQSAGYWFADLLDAVSSQISPELRVRFTSPHPKDYPTALLQLMAERPNICNHLHMPAQSGSTSMLKRMKRGYSRDAYLDLIASVHEYIPDVAISSDFIAGFCSETEQEHQDTVSLMEQVQYDQAFMFAYSRRDQTHAARTMQDDVPPEVKQRRLAEIIDTFQRHVQTKNDTLEVGRLRLVLIEGESKRSKPGGAQWQGRTDQNKRVIFPVDDHAACWSENSVGQIWPYLDQAGFDTGSGLLSYQDWARVPLTMGDYVVVQITEAKGHTLRGRLLYKSNSLSSFMETDLSKFDQNSLQRATRFAQLLHESNDYSNSNVA